MTNIAWNQNLKAEVTESDNTEEINNNEKKPYKNETPNSSELGLDASSSSYFNTLKICISR